MVDQTFRGQQARTKLNHRSESVPDHFRELIEKVEPNPDVNESLVEVLRGASKSIKDAIASGDPANVQNVADQFEQNVNALSIAVTKNTESDTQMKNQKEVQKSDAKSQSKSKTDDKTIHTSMDTKTSIPPTEDQPLTGRSTTPTKTGDNPDQGDPSRTRTK